MCNGNLQTGFDKTWGNCKDNVTSVVAYFFQNILSIIIDPIGDVRMCFDDLTQCFFKMQTTKFVAESLDETCKEGDTVRIMETRPLSKTKRWRLVQIIERAK